MIGFCFLFGLGCLPQAERFDTGEAVIPPVGLDAEGWLSAAHSHSCSLDEAGKVACWGTSNGGDWDYGQVRDVPGNLWRAVGAGDFYSCALDEAGVVFCWGFEMDFASLPALASLNVGDQHLCGLDKDHVAHCVGRPGEVSGRIQAPEARFAQVSAGNGHSCGLTHDGEVQCWGDDEKGQASPPKDSFTQVSAGAFQTCGILATGGGIKCWGELVANPPSGDFTMVSASRTGSHACAVRTSGVATCWGLNSIGQASGDVDGSFTYISAGGTHSCATQTDGKVRCWGNDIYGQASPPGR